MASRFIMGQRQHRRIRELTFEVATMNDRRALLVERYAGLIRLPSVGKLPPDSTTIQCAASQALTGKINEPVNRTSRQDYGVATISNCVPPCLHSPVDV